MKAYVYNGFRVLVKVFGKKGFSEKLEIGKIIKKKILYLPRIHLLGS